MDYPAAGISARVVAFHIGWLEQAARGLKNGLDVLLYDYGLQKRQATGSGAVYILLIEPLFMEVGFNPCVIHGG